MSYLLFISVCFSHTTTKLQDALAAIQNCQLIPAHKFPAVKSSDEFAKEKTLPVKKREGSL